MKKLFFILLLSTGMVHAQDAKTDFKRINENYYGREKMSMAVSYELFFDDDKTFTDREDGVYKREKNQYFVRQAGNEMLISDKHMIMVDNESKTIIVGNAADNVSPVNPLSINLDSILNFYENVEFYKTGKNNALYGYVFTLRGGPYSKINIVFDPATLFIKEIVNTYRDKMPDNSDRLRTARLKTSFSETRTGGAAASDFNEAAYVVNAGGKIKPAKKYKAYKVLTNLKNL